MDLGLLIVPTAHDSEEFHSWDRACFVPLRYKHVDRARNAFLQCHADAVRAAASVDIDSSRCHHSLPTVRGEYPSHARKLRIVGIVPGPIQ